MLQELARTEIEFRFSGGTISYCEEKFITSNLLGRQDLNLKLIRKEIP